MANFNQHNSPEIKVPKTTPTIYVPKSHASKIRQIPHYYNNNVTATVAHQRHEELNNHDHNVAEEEANTSNFDHDRDLPPGFRFNALDSELILCYLIPKIKGQKLPYSPIHVDNLYQYSPDKLAEIHKPALDQNEWYFLTPRDKKYKYGDRPNRGAGSGYWKATGADKPIHDDDGKIVGCKKALVFYEGKPGKNGNGEKTNWIMHEYRIKDKSSKKKNISNRNSDVNDMKLDDYVLCRIFKSSERYKFKNQKGGGQSIGDVSKIDKSSGFVKETENNTPISHDGDVHLLGSGTLGDVSKNDNSSGFLQETENNSPIFHHDDVNYLMGSGPLGDVSKNDNSSGFLQETEDKTPISHDGDFNYFLGSGTLGDVSKNDNSSGFMQETEDNTPVFHDGDVNLVENDTLNFHGQSEQHLDYQLMHQWDFVPTGDSIPRAMESNIWYPQAQLFPGMNYLQPDYGWPFPELDNVFSPNFSVFGHFSASAVNGPSLLKKD